MPQVRFPLATANVFLSPTLVTKETYIGITGNAFNTRFRNHAAYFMLNKRSVTELSKYIWSLNDKNMQFPLRTFALIVFAHPYCARNSCRNVTPRNAMSACAEETFQTNIGLVAVAITSLAVYSLEWSVTPNFFFFFFDRQLCFAILDIL